MSTFTTDRAPLDRLLLGLGTIVKDVQDDVIADSAALMREIVHVITGKTLGSIEENYDEGTVTAEFGAVFEVAKGGGHDFATPSYEEAISHADGKATDIIIKVMGGGL